jgi:spore coat polysaccharide biosynthesis protein SpsF (cytidylyltransferase family)
MTRVVSVIQARATSTRLPGKVLMRLGEASVLAQLVARARAADVGDVVVATSDEPSDDGILVECREIGVPCVRGSLNDVLGRCAAALRQQRADVGVRLTADCPMHDPEVIRHAVDLFRSSTVDYVSNVDERTYPDGLDVEVFAADALFEAERKSTARFEREHVTPWLRRHCSKRSFVQKEDVSGLRWTLDDPMDLAFMEGAFASITTPCFSARDVYRWLIERPESIHVAPGTPPTTEMVRRMQALIDTSTTRRNHVRNE